MDNILEYLHRQAAFSKATFGPGSRTEGVLKHIEEEIGEVRSAKTHDERIKEWSDIVILAFDGLTRELQYGKDSNYAGLPFSAIGEEAWWAVVRKQEKNELRDWPDWRGKPEDQPINHIGHVNVDRAQLVISYDN